MEGTYFKEVTRSPAHVALHLGHVSDCDIVRTHLRPRLQIGDACLVLLQMVQRDIGNTGLYLLAAALRLGDDVLPTTLLADQLCLFDLLIFDNGCLGRCISRIYSEKHNLMMLF